MGIFDCCVIMITTSIVSVGCVGADVSEGPAVRENARTTSLALTKRGNSPDPVLMPRTATKGSNVLAPIPFTGADQSAAYTPVVTIGPESPADGPRILERQPQAATVAAPVTCQAAPALNLDCPDDAPVPSSCTSAQGLPAGCQSKVTQGAFYPSQAYPACCR